MEKQLLVSVPGVTGEEGLSVACKSGDLFRNDKQLENLYKDGFRIYDYSIIDEKKPRDLKETLVKVFLKK